MFKFLLELRGEPTLKILSLLPFTFLLLVWGVSVDMEVGAKRIGLRRYCTTAVPGQNGAF